MCSGQGGDYKMEEKVQANNFPTVYNTEERKYECQHYLRSSK